MRQSRAGAATTRGTDTCTPERATRTEQPLRTNQEFKARAENALRWLNRNEAEGLTNMVESTQRRLGAVIKLKGARTSY